MQRSIAHVSFPDPVPRAPSKYWRPANSLPLAELETRWDYADPAFEHGIPEDFSIDQSKDSLFGASKVAGDITIQDYGRYFGMPNSPPG